MYTRFLRPHENMAASSLNAVRVRLYFDYPPPCMPDCRMSWVLVDLNKCRVVADLCSIIREKFDYNGRTVLDLFIENCFLPPAESIYVVRDNDSIRVKVSSVSSEHAGEKKRCREDEGSFQAPTKKKRHEVSEVNGVAHPIKKKKKHKAKKKKKKDQQMESGDVSKAVVPAKESSSTKSLTDKSNKKASVPPSVVTNGKAVSSGMQNKSSDSSDSSEEGSWKPVPVKSKHAPGAVSKQPAAKKTSSSDSPSEEENGVHLKKSSNANTSLKTCPSTKTPKQQMSSVTPKSASNSTTAKKTQTQSSSDSSSSEDDATAVARKTEPGKFTNTAQTRPCSDSGATVENSTSSIPSTPVGTKLQDNEDKAESSDSSDTELVIKRPNLQIMVGLTPRGRARGFPDRVRGRGGVRGSFGRARGTPWKQNINYNYDTEEQRKQKEIQTNKSLVLQNPAEASPRMDYSTLPLLAAPPAVGQKIVFKLLELTENYTPEVSDYKEGKIIGFNHSTNMIELELLTRSHARTEPGKFDLVYQDPDGSERVEYAVTGGSQLTERWESLLEPRLIVQDVR